jgi:hypothetical protein
MLKLTASTQLTAMEKNTRHIGVMKEILLITIAKVTAEKAAKANTLSTTVMMKPLSTSRQNTALGSIT